VVVNYDERCRNIHHSDQHRVQSATCLGSAFNQLPPAPSNLTRRRRRHLAFPQLVISVHRVRARVVVVSSICLGLIRATQTQRTFTTQRVAATCSATD